MPGGRRGPVSKTLRELTAMRLRVGRERRVSLDEAVEITGTLSRRRFLQAGGVAGAGLLLGGCTSSGPRSSPLTSPIGGKANEPRIAIVGAGLAGLAAAYWLTRAGVRVSVYEALDRIGGRCWSARGFDGGQVAEHGGEFVDTRHVHIGTLAEELGLELDDLWGTWISGSRWPTYVDGQIVRSEDLFEPLDEAAREIVRVAERNGPWWADEADADARAFDEMSMADWFDANVPGGLDSPLGRAFSLEQAGWFGLDPDHLSATNLIDFYAVEYPGGDERYTVHGGNDQIPDRIHASLPDGTVHVETPLEALRLRRDEAVELSFGGVSSSVIADRVILALPFTALRQADLSDSGMSAMKMRSIEELGMGTNAKLLLQFSSDHHSFDGWSGGMDRVDDPMFTTWESGSTDGLSASRMSLITVYSGGHVGAGYAPPQPHGPPPKRVIVDTLAAMDAVVPGVGAAFNGKAWLDSWVDDPWASGSYAAFLPGQYSRFSGVTGKPEGTIHFAGEHTSSFSQGFLNGGVESGERAAVEVLDALGRPVPPGLRRTMRAAQEYRPRYPW
jgi:monoamine oxidase